MAQQAASTFRDSSPGGIHLDAAALATAATGAVVVDADVPAFGSAAGAAVIDVPAKNNSRADAGAERGVENVAKSDACAPDCFR